MGILNKIVMSTAPWMPKFVVGRIAAVYVAGDKLDDGINLVRKLNKKGFVGTLDLLGEEVRNRRGITKTTKAYCELIEGIANSGVDCNISLKLTALGLKVDESLCWDNLSVILDNARTYNTFVRMDMEDSEVTEATIRMCKKSVKYYPNCGTVLQAYMHRSNSDIDLLKTPNSNIRLCKGAYKEDKDIAFQDYDEIRNNYLECAKKMIENNIYSCFATHDLWLIENLEKMLEESNYSKSNCEFQALSGVPIDKTLERLISKGYAVRYYIPYGPDWYPYSLRRIRENPDIWKDTMKAFFFRSKHRK
ncbi:MAG: proline dehydrogenase [Euryarchaeota archaeon]|nr:proline dehydrogenase [Euryarchaeota archaeon]|tara:strand:- start:33847 stop:34761 length:915 start_codon:yes stop_codon:yes gene_type:complete